MTRHKVTRYLAYPLAALLLTTLFLSEATTTQATSTPTVAYAKGYARRALGPVQYRCLDRIATYESRWNPRAVNRTSGAYGIPQALPGYKMRSAGEDWKTNPVTQVKWMMRYVHVRYGSACGGWQHILAYGWY